jgi:hypothetical protein
VSARLEARDLTLEPMAVLNALLSAQRLISYQAGYDIRIAPSSGTEFTATPDVVVSPRPQVRRRSSERRTLTDLAAEISLQPVRADGVQRGYRVYPRRDAAHFASIGLDPGDLVLSINGLALGDPRLAEQVFQRAVRAPRVTVQIERAGRRAHLQLVNSVDGRPLSGPALCGNGPRDPIYVQLPPVAVSREDMFCLGRRDRAGCLTLDAATAGQDVAEAP